MASTPRWLASVWSSALRRAMRHAAQPAWLQSERVAVAKSSGGKLSLSKVLEMREPKPVVRRPQAAFNFEEWSRQTRTVVEMRFRSVPQSCLLRASEFLAQLAQEFGTE